MFDGFSLELSHFGLDQHFLPSEADSTVLSADHSSHSSHYAHHSAQSTPHNHISSAEDSSSVFAHHCTVPETSPSFPHSSAPGSSYDYYSSFDESFQDQTDHLQEQRLVAEQWFDDRPAYSHNLHAHLCNIHDNSQLDSAIAASSDKHHDLFLLTPNGDYKDIGEATADLDGTGVNNTVIKNIGATMVTYTDYDGDGFVDAINEVSPDGSSKHYDLVSGNWVQKATS